MYKRKQQKYFANIIFAPGINVIGIQIVGEVYMNVKGDSSDSYLHKVLSTVREINRLLISEKDSLQLVKKTCKVLTDQRGYSFSWIILFDKKQNITHVESGESIDGFDKLREKVVNGDLPKSHLRALKEKKLVVIDQIHKDCPFDIRDLDLTAYIAPIQIDGEVLGLLCSGVPKEIAANKIEEQTYFDIANNIGFALASINEQKDIIHIFNESPDGLISFSQELEIININPSFCQLMGIDKSAIVGRDGLELIKQHLSGEALDLALSLIDKLRKGEQFKQIELSHNGKVYALSSSFKSLARNSFIRVRDVTRIKSEQELIKKSEEKYRSLINSLSDSLFIVQDGLIKFVNPALSKVSGYTEEELLQSNFTNYIAPEEVERVMEIHKQRLMSQDVSFSYESIALTKSGIKLNVDVNVIPVEFDGRQAIQVILRDISAYVERNRLLNIEKTRVEESEHRYHSLFAGSASVVLLVDPEDGNIVDANQAACNFYKYELDEIKNLNIGAINTSCNGELMKDLSTSDKHTRQHLYFQHRLANGMIKDVEVYAGPVSLDGKVLIYSVVHDITLRMRAEKKLQESERLVNTIIQSMPSGFLLIGEDYKIYKVNDRTCEISGFTKEELEGEMCDIICPKGAVSKECPIWECNMSCFSGMDTFIKCKGGEKTPILKNAQTIEIDGKKYILESFQDISDWKKTEKELIKAKEMAEESDRLKSAFLANMSHEIRTPINGIMGFTDLLKDPDLEGEDQKMFVDVIHSSGERMLNTINDIIDISKIESGLVEVESQVVKLTDFMNDLNLFFHSQSVLKSIEMILDLNGGEPINELVIDRDKLNSILTNLLRNAIKFTKNGTITFGYKLIDTNIEFFVADTGIGIKKDRQQAIFDRFVQADVTVSREFEGSGLGLSISKSLAEMMGGSIRLESEVGKGTTFYVNLPLNISV